MSEDQVRSFVPGDEVGILELFNATFHTARSRTRWEWQFSRNPQGAGHISLAERDGELLGHYAVMHQKLNVAGQQVHAAQSCDTMVRGDQRGKRWFVRLSEHCYAEAESAGIKIVYGFPNRNSFPGFVRSLKWHRIAALKEYSCRTDVSDLVGGLGGLVFRGMLSFRGWLRERILRRALKGAHIVASREIPSSVDALLKELQNYEVLSVWKDWPYMQWRYERHPEHKYVCHVLYQGDSAEALLITRESQNSVAVCELLHRRKDVLQSAYLLNTIISDAVRKRIRRVEFFGHDDGFFDSVFGQCGLRSVYSTGLVFGGRVFSDSELERRFILPQNWTVVYGDTDVV